MIAIRLSDASFRAYLDLGSRRETEEFHAAMRAAERAGAIRIEWDERAGEDGQIRRIVLAERDKLASHLAVTPLWDAYIRALQRLSQHQEHPGVRRLLNAWQEGKRPRNIGPDDMDKVQDALSVISALTGSDEDIPVRQMSARLFNDSKRIEALVPILDFLTQEDETCTIARQPEDLLATLGLIRYPQPTLVAGRAKLILKNGDTIRIPSPYIGVAPQSLDGIEIDPDSRYMLTIENFTPFNEIAKGKAGPVDGIVLYTGGMPSPSFLRVYKMMLGEAPMHIPLYHWGDIDLGGFRIADVLARHAELLGRALRLWNMNPAEHANIPRWRDLARTEISWMHAIAEKHGWTKEWAGIQATGAAYEQEMVDATRPFA